MAYDPRRQSVLLFGGADATRVCGDTWGWDGTSWTQLSAAGPAPRTFPAMTCDSARREALLFGGNRVLFGKDERDYEFYADLWRWNGRRWRLATASGPAGRAEAALAFDSQRGRAVLFGGYNRSGSQIQPLGDTWEWDGRGWTQVSETGPSPRYGAAMSYDNQRGRVVLFGGPVRNSGGGETWEWDGQGWRQIGSATTERRYNSVMAYDEQRQKILRFGGWNGAARVSETWEYDGATWQAVNAAGPEARNHTALAYDRARGCLALYGGHDGSRVFGDTWEWRGGRWERRAYRAPVERADNGH
jgi:hypothetical protein